MANPVPLPKELNPEGYANLIEFFSRSCKAHAQVPAFSCMGQTISFESFAEQVYALSAWLQNLPDVSPGDRIAIQLPNLNQYPLIVWAAIHAGLIVVNSNPLYTESELNQQYADAEPKIFVGLVELMETVSKVCRSSNIQKLVLTHLGGTTEGPVLADDVSENCISLSDALEQGAQMKYTQITPGLNDLVALQYTGGTTGQPKGAMLSHGNFLAHIAQVNHTTKDYLEPQKDNIVLPLPVYHVFGFSIACMFSIANGLHCVLITDPRNTDALIDTLKQYPPNMFVGINSLSAAIMQHPKTKELDFSAAKRFISGGTALTQDVAKRWEATSKHAIYEGYGLTEVTCTLTASTSDKRRIGSVGPLVIHSEAKCVDEHDRLLSAGEPGELCARGPQIMQGYWRKPKETAECLDADGWLRTGDIATIAEDGMIEIVDRKKDMILVSGFNVYPNEIEDVATRYPPIVEAGAIGVADEKSGEAVKLYVVSEDPALDTEKLRDFCREHLAPYKIPRTIQVVDSLPKTPVGKILRRALREMD
jgi:long-chain acyl-CoA synthetase